MRALELKALLVRDCEPSPMDIGWRSMPCRESMVLERVEAGSWLSFGESRSLGCSEILSEELGLQV